MGSPDSDVRDMPGMLVRCFATYLRTASLTAMSTSRGRRAAARVGALAALVATSLAAPASSTATTPSVVGGDRLATSGVVVDTGDTTGGQPLPEVAASAWLLADLATGEVLAARDPHGRFRPASTLKVLTALTVLPQLDPSATYVAQWADANAEGSKVGVVPDAPYSVHNLMEAMLLVSGNDAAHALANAAGGPGGVEATVARMNEVARSLGALDTRAVNPSGLDAPGQLTSAYDLAVIARAALAREDFRTYVTTVKSQFPGKVPAAGKVRKTYEIYTQNRLLLSYRGAIGVKTGWTTKARGTFVGAATRGGRTLVATVLRSRTDAWKDAESLLTWGFRNASVARPVGTLQAVSADQPEPAAAGTSPEAPAQVTAAGAGGAGTPWWVQVPVVVLGVLAALRGRVLLRRRLRRARARSLRAGGLPQPRDRRRVSTPAAAAPTPAPSTKARLRPRDPAEDPATSASTGTAS